MFKTLITTLMFTPVLFAGQTVFQCASADTEITIKLDFAEPVHAASLFTRAQVHVSDETGDHDYCTPFQIKRNYFRIGYQQNYQGRLPNGTEVLLSERALENEGPAEFSHGTLKSSAGEVPLTCTKS